MIAWWSVAGEPWTVLLASAPALAIAIDRLLGEPPLRWHPVAWMGRWLAWAGERLAPRVGEARVLSDARVFWFAALSWCAAAALSVSACRVATAAARPRSASSARSRSMAQVRMQRRM